MGGRGWGSGPVLGVRRASLSLGEKLLWKSRRRWKQAPGSQGSLWLLLAKPLSNARWEASAKSERAPNPLPASPPEPDKPNKSYSNPGEEGGGDGGNGGSSTFKAHRPIPPLFRSIWGLQAAPVPFAARPRGERVCVGEHSKEILNCIINRLKITSAVLCSQSCPRSSAGDPALTALGFIPGVPGSWHGPPRQAHTLPAPKDPLRRE